MLKNGGANRSLLLLLCLVSCLRCSCQECTDEDCSDERPHLQVPLKDKIVKGLNKALVYISYLNYSDRTTDRVFTGPAEFEPYKGKIIRKIEIKILDPFGVTLENTVAGHYTRFQKFANSIQFKTREWAVKNELLFRAGERVVPIQFADTEKNLWQGGTFKDLKIYVVPVDDDEDKVDVLMVLQDRWSWSISTGMSFYYCHTRHSCYSSARFGRGTGNQLQGRVNIHGYN